MPAPLLKTVLVCLALSSMRPDASAQTAEITVDLKPTPAEVKTWLAGEDQRMVAWGAYFAAQQKDDGEVTLLLRRVESWMPPPEQPSEAKWHREYAMRNVLDALIQQRESVPVEGVAAIADSFPVQAAILASRLPIAETTPRLAAWYGDGTGSGWTWRPRVAAMMLAKAPPEGFAASVLNLSEEKLAISVWDEVAHVGAIGGSNSCGDSIGGGTPKGWPPEFGYVLEEDRAPEEGLGPDPDLLHAIVVISGGDRITYRRIDEHGGHGSCRMVRGLSPENRHHLIAEMLGVSDADVAWETAASKSIHWENVDQCRTDLAAAIAGEEALFKQAADALMAKGYLTKAESTVVRPKLIVTIFDDRRSKEIPLPGVAIHDARTVVSIETRQD